MAEVATGLAEVTTEVAIEVAIEVGRIASAAGSIEERAASLLNSLRSVVRYRAARIALFDPNRCAYVFLAAHGYDRRLRAYLTSPAALLEAANNGLTRSPRPLRCCDRPVPAAESRMWTDYLWPAGIYEGIALGLFTPGGRHLGIVNLHIGSSVPPSEGVRDLIGALGPTIANAVDPMRSITAVAQLVSQPRAGVVLAHTGRPLDLLTLPGDPLLAAGSTVLDLAVASLPDDQVCCSFLWLDGRKALVRVTAVRCPLQAGNDLSTVVLLSPPGDLHRLTRRELQILGLLVGGSTDRHLADFFGIGLRTVNTHLEHIREKLDASCRTAAAVYALRHGLYLPPSRPPSPTPTRSRPAPIVPG